MNRSFLQHITSCFMTDFKWKKIERQGNKKFNYKFNINAELNTTPVLVIYICKYINEN